MEILARAVGRRKEAVAQVQMIKGTGLVMINNKPANDYLQNNSCAILAVQAPFEVFSANLSLPKKNSVFDKTNTLTTDVLTSNNNGSNADNLANQTMPTNAAAAALTEIDTIIKVKGGGLKGQADAIRLGISRALCLLDTFPAVVNTSTVTLNSGLQTTGAAGSNNSVPALSAQTMQASETQTMVVGLKKQLKDKGYLTQDSRVKERRKYGLKKARKASQYHKR